MKFAQRTLICTGLVFVLFGGWAQDPGGTDDDIAAPERQENDSPILGRQGGAGGMPYIRLCGFPEMLEGLREYDGLSLDDIQAAHEAAYPRVLRVMERRTRPGRRLSDRLNAMYTVAEVYAGQGDMDRCIAQLEAIVALLDENGVSAKGYRQFLRSSLGVAHMRRGEVVNCINNHNVDSCIVPLRQGGIHVDPTGFRRAKEYFLEYLKEDPDHLQVRWLVNVVSMGLGEYPDKVPPELLMHLPQPDPSVTIGRFRDVAMATGVNPWDEAGGAIVDDFNGDGLLDIFTVTWDASGPARYYQNNGDGSFADRTEEAGLSGQRGGLNCVQGDYDNDGDLDVLILRGAWLKAKRNTLLQNDGTGRFKDVTEDAGLLAPVYPSHAAAFADYDLDGDLDLLIGNETWSEHSRRNPTQLFRNRGDGTFEDVSIEAGIDVALYIKGVTWGDYDNDGDPDLFLSNIHGDNRLFRNNRDGTFSDVTAEAGVTGPSPTFPCWFFDYDNDGWLDLFVACYEDPIDTYRGYVGRPAKGAVQALYRNRRDGTFENVSSQAGLGAAAMTMGANYGDLDTDGRPDIYLGTGAPPYGDVVPNVAYLNLGGERYTDVTVPTGLGHLQKGHGIAFADIDNDGDQDIYAQLGGAVDGDAFSNALFLNPGNGNNWLTVRLRGRTSNSFGVGCRIEVNLTDDNGSRTVHTMVDSGGSFGASSLQQEIGLGPGGRIESLSVTWPASGTTQTFEGVEANRIVEITEGGDQLVEIDLPRLELGSATDGGHHHHGGE